MRLSRLSLSWRRGFSLPTLLITLVIVGILGAVGLFYQRSVTRSAATTVMKADLRQYAGAWARAQQGDSVVPPVASQFLSRGVRPVVNVATPTSRVLVVSHPRTPEVCRVVVDARGAGAPQCGVPEPAVTTADPSYTVQTERVTRADGVAELAVVVRPGSWTNVPLPNTVPVGALPPMPTSGTAPAGESVETPSTIVLTTPGGDVVSAPAAVARDSGLRFVLPEGSALPEDLDLLGMTASGRLRADGGSGGGGTSQMFTTSLGAGITTATRGTPVVFSTTGLTVGGTAPTVYNWNFGDGTFSSSASPSKTFLTAGTYTVRLTMANAVGTVGTPLTLTITVVAPTVPVGNQAPVAVLSSSLAWIGLNTPVVFSGASSTDSDGSVVSYRFEVNGVVVNGTNRTMTTSFRTAGTYTARLTVTDNAGATHVTTMPVTVSAAAAPFDASKSTVAVTPNSLIAGGSGTVTVTVRNVNNLPMANQSVALSTTAGTAALNLGAATVTTNAQGVATTTVTTGLATGSATVTATRSGTSIGTLTVNVVPGSVAALIGEVGAPSPVAQSGVLMSPVTVQTAAAGGQSVAAGGRVVAVSVASGAASLSGTLTATTNGSGAATFSNATLTGTAGTITLRFTSAGLSPVEIPVALGAGAAAFVAATGGQNQTGGVGTALSTPLTVRVTDASGNVVSGASVTFSPASGSAAPATATTNASGLASTTWTLGGGAGAQTLSATVAGLTAAGFSATGTAAAADTVVWITTPPAGQAGIAFPTQPVVEVRDSFGNPVSGSVVTLSLPTTGMPSGTLQGTSLLATSNAQGRATWTDARIDGSIGTYALLARTGSTTASRSANLTISAGVATNLSSITGSPSSGSIGEALPTMSVRLRDAWLNEVSQAGVSVTASLFSGLPTLSGTLTTTTDADGRATFADLTVTGLVGDRRIRFTAAGGLTPATTGAITFAPGAPASLAIEQGDNQTATVGTAVPVQLRTRVLDASGNLVPAVMVTYTVTSGGGSRMPSNGQASTGGTGIAALTSWTLGTSMGTNTITASLGSLTPVVFTATGTAGAATTLTVTSGQGQTGVVGTALTNPVIARVTDTYGNPVSGRSVTFTPSGNGSAGTPTATTNANGEASSLWTLGTTAGSQSLSVASTGLTGSPAGVSATATPAAPTALTLTTDASATTASGATISPAPAVQLRDTYGNAVALAGETITASRTTGAATLSGTLSATTNSSGVATFSALSLAGLAGEAQTLTFTHGASSATVLSRSITLTAGAATTLAIDGGNAQTQTVGLAVSTAPRVRVSDAQGNAVSGTSVTFSVTTGGGSVTGATTTTNASGLASVGSWTLGTSVGSNGLTASAAGLTPSSVVFTATSVAGSAATISSWSGEGQTGTVGTALTNALVVLVVDQYFNPVAGTSVSFTPSAGSVGTTTVLTDASGFALRAWTLGTVAGSQTVSVASTGLSGSPVTFTATATPAAVAALSLTTNVPATSAAGANMSPAPVVQLRDTYGNAVSQSGVPITVSRTTGAGTLGGTTSASTNASGVATFSALSLSGSAGTSNILTFASTGLTSIASTSTTLTAGSAAALSITTNVPATTAAGATIVPAPTVQLRDAFGNAVSQSGISVTVSRTTGAGTLSGTLSATTNASGVATFSTIALAGTAGTSNTLTFASTGLTSIASSSIALTAGAAATLAINAGNTQSATVGSSVATAPQVIIRDASSNPVSGVSVTFSMTTGGGSVTGGTTTTNASGLASAGSWTLGTAVGSNSLAAASTGLTSVVFTATGTVGAAANLVKVAGDGQNGTVGAAVSTNPSIRVVDAFGNGVPGHQVYWQDLSGNGAPGVFNATTDATGHASTSWTLGTLRSRTRTNQLRSSTSFGAGTNWTQNAITIAENNVTGPASLGIQGHTLTQGATASDPYLGQSPAATLSGTQAVSWSVYLKAGTARMAYLVLYPGNVGGGAVITTVARLDGSSSPGSIERLTSASGANITVTNPTAFVEPAGNGWYRVGVSATVAVASGSVTPLAIIARWEGGAGDTFLFAAPQLEYGVASPGAYIPTSTGAVSATQSETFRLAVTGVAVTGTASQIFTATAATGAPSASTSTVTASLATITASSGSSQTTVAATIRDAFSNPIAGQAVVFATGTLQNLTTGSLSATTNAAGQATLTLSTTQAPQSGSVSVSAGGTTMGSVTVSSVPAAVSTSQSTIALSPSSINISSGSTTSQITVTARDAFSNPVAGTSVVLSVPTAVTLQSGTGTLTANASGQVVGTASSLTAGTFAIGATVNGSAITPSASLVVTAPAPVSGNTNLELWLRADMGVVGTTAVSQWQDQSGKARHAVAFGSVAPSFQATGLNGRPALSFGGSGGLRVPNLPLGAFTVSMVFRARGTAGLIWEQGTNVNTQDGAYLYGQHDCVTSVNRGMKRHCMQGNSLLPWATDNQVKIVTVTYDGAATGPVVWINGTTMSLTQFYFLNGVQQPTTASAGDVGVAQVTSDLYLMTRGNNAVQSTGEVQEVLAYSRALSVGERSTLEADLKTRWGINSQPVVDFTWGPTRPSPGIFAGFLSSASDPDGSIASYAWDFGDLTTSSAQNPSKAFTASGSYVVSLIVTDNGGATRQQRKVLQVNQPPVIGLFTANQGSVRTEFGTRIITIPAGTTVRFSSGATDPDGTISRFLWYVGGNNVSGAVGAITVVGSAGASSTCCGEPGGNIYQVREALWGGTPQPLDVRYDRAGTYELGGYAIDNDEGNTLFNNASLTGSVLVEVTESTSYLDWQAGAAPVGASSVSFSRASVATYLLQSGKVAGVATGVLRDAHYEQGAQSILVEPASTNLWPLVHEGFASNLTTSRSSLTAATGSPSWSTESVLRLVPTAGVPYAHIYGHTLFNSDNGGWETASFFVRSVGNYQVVLATHTNDPACAPGFGFTLSGAGTIHQIGRATCSANAAYGFATTASPTITALSDGWYRISLTFNMRSGGFNSQNGGPPLYLWVTDRPDLDPWGRGNWSPNGTSGVEIWGQQREKLPFPTSLIITSNTGQATASVTRAADDLAVNLSSAVPLSTVTLFADYTHLSTQGDGRSNAGIVSYGRNVVGGAVLHTIYDPAGGGGLRSTTFTGGTGPYSIVDRSGLIAYGTRVSVAATARVSGGQARTIQSTMIGATQETAREAASLYTMPGAWQSNVLQIGAMDSWNRLPIALRRIRLVTGERGAAGLR